MSGSQARGGARGFVPTETAGPGFGSRTGDPARRLGPVQRVGEELRGGPITGSTGGEVEDHGLDRILTAPNAITLVRLACIPLFLWLLFGAGDQTAAAVLLAKRFWSL